MRFQAWQSGWAHSFTRLVTYIRAALWLERDLYSLLKGCGTADVMYYIETFTTTRVTAQILNCYRPSAGCDLVLYQALALARFRPMGR